jgi:hypothetical protein
VPFPPSGNVAESETRGLYSKHNQTSLWLRSVTWCPVTGECQPEDFPAQHPIIFQSWRRGCPLIVLRGWKDTECSSHVPDCPSSKYPVNDISVPLTMSPLLTQSYPASVFWCKRSGSFDFLQLISQSASIYYVEKLSLLTSLSQSQQKQQ